MIPPKIIHGSLLMIGSIIGFGVGMIPSPKGPPPPVTQKQTEAEVSLIFLDRLEGDSVVARASGPVRVVWGEENFADFSATKSGAFQIPLGQIPNPEDIKFQDFAFVGNANTQKFYPSTSQFARGVKVSDRRFFATKEAAIAGGFIPSKLVP